jgi:hypothetical protein
MSFSMFPHDFGELNAILGPRTTTDLYQADHVLSARTKLYIALLDKKQIRVRQLNYRSTIVQSCLDWNGLKNNSFPLCRDAGECPETLEGC